MSLTPAEIVRMVSRLTARDQRLARAMHGGSAVGDPGALEASLVDAAAVLEGAGLPYALIGGLAVAVHAGLPRATLGVDLAVASGTDADVLVRAFQHGGFTACGRHEHSLSFLHAGGDPVQLALDQGFDEPIARAEVIRLGSASIRIVRRDDLVRLKQRAAADRRRRRSKALRDQADVELLRGDLPGPDEGW